ncbi:MAG TPA: 3,4-dihydroxy-2-butanone-4-phosphate synthase [Gammaproteobacteria bacterium]|nr:3,4-dihydroxy-2-butanone-4-phosphate synthase [Gammaproteobacteria bacterium]
MKLDSTEDIIADIRAGKMVILMDDENRENEGDLIMAAEHATPEAIAFFVRYTSGIICLPMTAERLEELRLPQMVSDNTESHRTAFTVSVDYKHGTTTGISAQDRARTIRALADPSAKPSDFSRPGHIFPLRCVEGGVLCRAGHTEASVDLVTLAGLSSQAAVICEVVNDDGTMKRGAELEAFAREHRIRIGTIADLISYRLAREKTVTRIAEREVSTEFGAFTLYAYQDRVNNTVHFALRSGALDSAQPALVRVHLQNTLSDLVGVNWDDLGWPLRNAMRRIAKDGGVVVILRQQDDPASLIERLLDHSNTVNRGDDSGPAASVLRTYGIGAQILLDLGVRRMRVLSQPKRMQGLSGFGLEVVEYVNCD